MYYCGIDHLLARVKSTTLVTLTEGAGVVIGEQVAEFVRREASAVVDTYLTVGSVVTEALAGLTADIAVYLLYERSELYGTYVESGTNVVTNATTDTRNASATPTGTTATVVVHPTKTVQTPANTVSTNAATTTTVSPPTTTVSNLVTVSPTSITVTEAYTGTDSSTVTDAKVVTTVDSTVKTGTVTTATSAPKFSLTVPASVLARYTKALELLANTAFHPRLLGLRSQRFATSTYSDVAVLNGFF